jgi:hypothetical protein
MSALTRPRWAFLSSALLCIAASCVEAQAFVMSDAVAVQLRQAAASPTEHVYCLFGTWTRDSLVATSALPQAESLSTNHNVVAQTGCLALAVWHNHPVPADSVPASYLYFTTTDQHTFLTWEQAPIAIVGVRGGAWCAWTRLEIKRAWDLHLVPLRPVVGQCHA